MATMPNCIGLEYEDALTAMVTAGVRVIPLLYFQAEPVSISWVKSAVANGVVTAQVPTSGTTGVVANSPVNLTVSSYKVGVVYP